jgi:hypothetical protein
MIAIACCALGCSARVSPISALEDAAVDTAVDTAAEVPDLANEVHCGPQPWIPHKWQWSTSDKPPKPVAGMRARVDVCPDKTAVTGADGALMLYVHEGTRYSVLVDAPDRRDPTAHGEYQAAIPLSDAWYLLPRTPGVPLLGETFDLSHGGVGPIKYLDPALRGSPCEEEDGTSYTVVDHPEAKVHYRDAKGVEVDAGAVPLGGDSFIDGLLPGEHVVVKGSKPGCSIITYDPAYPFIKTTGLHPGYVSYVRVDVELPDAGGP